jgi:uncharacterized protein YaiI (UPF0178 family)
MKILVDADACPVKEIIVKEAKSRGIGVTMFIDTSHILNDGYSKIITVDKARDSADFALIAQAHSGDIVVTQDFGVAAMALTVGAYAINQNGLIFTKDNIDALLNERHISQKIRRAGGRTSNHPKRTHENDLEFKEKFLKLLTLSLS